MTTKLAGNIGDEEWFAMMAPDNKGFITPKDFIPHADGDPLKDYLFRNSEKLTHGEFLKLMTNYRSRAVSSFITRSPEGDEIDYEWVGKNPNEIIRIAKGNIHSL